MWGGGLFVFISGPFFILRRVDIFETVMMPFWPGAGSGNAKLQSTGGEIKAPMAFIWLFSSVQRNSIGSPHRKCSSQNKYFSFTVSGDDDDLSPAGSIQSSKETNG